VGLDEYSLVAGRSFVPAFPIWSMSATGVWLSGAVGSDGTARTCSRCSLRSDAVTRGCAAPGLGLTSASPQVPLAKSHMGETGKPVHSHEDSGAAPATVGESRNRNGHCASRTGRRGFGMP